MVIDFAKVEAFRSALLIAVQWEYERNEKTRKQAMAKSGKTYSPAEKPSLEEMSAAGELNRQWWKLSLAPYALLNCDPDLHFALAPDFRDSDTKFGLGRHATDYARGKLAELNAHRIDRGAQIAILREEFDRHAPLRAKYRLEDSTRLRDIHYQVKRTALERIDFEDGVYDFAGEYVRLLNDFFAQVDRLAVELHAYVANNPHVVESHDNGHGTGKVDCVSVPHLMDWAVGKGYAAPEMCKAYALTVADKDAPVEVSLHGKERQHYLKVIAGLLSKAKVPKTETTTQVLVMLESAGQTSIDRDTLTKTIKQANDLRT